MQWAQVTRMEGATMGRPPVPTATMGSEGSGPRNSIGPNTAVVVKAWPLIVTAFSILAFAVALTWKVAAELNTINANATADRTRILILETSVATKADVQAASEAGSRRMRKMLGRVIISCDKFGGASTCRTLLPADEGD